MSTLRILWIQESAYFAGGAERYVSETAELLKPRGVRSVLLYAANPLAQSDFLARFDEAYPIVDLVRQVQELRPDIIYIHQAPLTIPIRALVHIAPTVRFFHDHSLFCLRDHKYTTIEHETCTRTVGWRCYPCLGFVQRTHTWSKVRLRTVASLLENQSEHMALNAIVVGSKYMKEHVVAHGFDAARIHVIHPFVRRTPRVEGIARESALLLFVGALLRGKGLDILLQAMTDAPSTARLVVAGAGEQESWLRAMVNDLDLGKRIEFLGRVPREKLHQWYARATCLIVPSRNPETFGLVGPEAMLHGTPVIASRVGGIHEWLIEGHTGMFFPSGDSKALATTIRRMLASDDVSRSMGEAARHFCESRFRPEDHAAQLLELFKSLRAGSRK